ncbi:hypothetical protein Tco_0846542 [Tanacetum coccineum]
MVTGWRSGDDDSVLGDGNGGEMMKVGDHDGGGLVVKCGVGWRWGGGEAAGGRNLAKKMGGAGNNKEGSVCMDMSKITRKPSKTGKHGHENGRACKSQKPKPEKVNLQSTENDTLAGVEAQRMMGFVLKALTEVAQMSQSRIATLAIRVRSFGDLTDENHYPIIVNDQGSRFGGGLTVFEPRSFSSRL